MRELKILCPHGCGSHLVIEQPGLSAPRRNPVARWWRRRVLRLLWARRRYQTGKAVETGLLFHYLLQCPAADDGGGG